MMEMEEEDRCTRDSIFESHYLSSNKQGCGEDHGDRWVIKVLDQHAKGGHCH